MTTFRGTIESVLPKILFSGFLSFFNTIQKVVPILELLYTIWKLAQCLKITQNVSFNIASEASYVYI